MNYPKPLRCLLFLLLIVLSFKSFSQTATGIGIAYGPNKPFSNDYSWSTGFQLFGNLAIIDKLEIVPNIGYETLNSKGRLVNVDPYYSKRISDIDLFCVGVSAKYAFSRAFFVKAGPILYVGGGNEDIAAIGIGGTAAGGINLDLDEHSTIELSLFATVINISSVGNGITPIGGLKVAYVFNFAHGKLKPPPR